MQEKHALPPTLLLGRNLGISVLSAIIATSHLGSLPAADLWSVPAIFLFANVVEWALHRFVMHRPRPMLRSVYESHARDHHVAFVRTAMAAKDPSEWHRVLIPGKEYLGLALITAATSVAVSAAFGPDIGWLTLLTLSLYVACYELAHLSLHLPAGHPLTRWPGYAYVHDHHAWHHDPGLMGRWNFNIFLPIADRFFGTYAPPALREERLAKAARLKK